MNRLVLAVGTLVGACLGAALRILIWVAMAYCVIRWAVIPALRATGVL